MLGNGMSAKGSASGVSELLSLASAIVICSSSGKLGFCSCT